MSDEIHNEMSDEVEILPHVRTLPPPLGIEPRSVWQRKRATNLCQAIERHLSDPRALSAVTEKWVCELSGLILSIHCEEKDRGKT